MNVDTNTSKINRKVIFHFNEMDVCLIRLHETFKLRTATGEDGGWLTFGVIILKARLT